MKQEKWGFEGWKAFSCCRLILWALKNESLASLTGNYQHDYSPPGDPYPLPIIRQSQMYKSLTPAGSLCPNRDPYCNTAALTPAIWWQGTKFPKPGGQQKNHRDEKWRRKCREDRGMGSTGSTHTVYLYRKEGFSSFKHLSILYQGTALWALANGNTPAWRMEGLLQNLPKGWISILHSSYWKIHDDGLALYVGH